MKFASIVAAAVMLVSAALPMSAAADTKHSGGPATATSADGAYRTHFGRADLYVPASFRVIDGTYDLLVHFHGMAQAQESNVNAAGLNAVVVSVNVGVGSDAYGQAFADPRAFDSLLASTTRAVEKSGHAPGATVRKIALSAWSAGFAAVGAILRDPAAASRVDAVLLADGLHAAYTDPKQHVLDERSLAKYVRVADAAMRGEKLFVLTHSSIPMPGYATSTEACETVTRLAGAQKEPPPAASPRKMKALYQVNRGGFHVQGFEGTDVKAHLDHIWAMGETMFPLLTARWSRPTIQS